MSDDATERAERARRRAGWPGGRYELGQKPGDELSATTTPAERVAMAAALSLELWRVSGRPLPTYERSTMPGRVFRPSESVPDDDDFAR